MIHNYIRDKKIVVYGFGQGFITFNEFVIKKLNLPVSIIIDKKFKSDTLVNNVPACSLESPSLCSLNKNEFICIVSVGSKQLYSEIAGDLRNAGFSNIISVFDVYEYHLSHAEPNILFAEPAYYLSKIEDIFSAYKLLGDEESQEVYLNLLEIYISKNLTKVRSLPLAHQYLPDDILLSKGYSRTINCGSFDDDTVQNIYRKKGKIKSLVCIEPSLVNYQKLVELIARNSEKFAEQTICFPVALSDTTKYIDFTAAGTNSSIDNKHEVETISNMCLSMAIDDMLPHYNVTFINMDIEGAELDALRGAINIIKRCKPDLAISVYHKPSHLWDILLFLAQNVAEYRFYMRNYTGYPAETVLYTSV